MTRSYLGYVSSQTTDFIPLMTYGVATGGTSSSITDNGVAYTLLSFTTDGTLTVSKEGLFDVFLVGGGGGGGARGSNGEASGGGAGGMVFQDTVYLTATTYTVDVGAGGVGGVAGVNFYALENCGYHSGIYNSTTAPTTVITAVGGGGGASSWGATGSLFWEGHAGGASFRSGYGGNSSVARTPLAYNGGSSNGSDTAGGGAGAGGAASSNTAGAGRTSTFSGSSVTYGIGGGGGNNSSDGTETTTANRGNGARGLRNGLAAAGGVAGYTGIVMVRFKV